MTTLITAAKETKKKVKSKEYRNKTEKQEDTSEIKYICHMVQRKLKKFFHVLLFVISVRN